MTNIPNQDLPIVVEQSVSPPHPLIEQTAVIVRQRMAGQQAGHGIDHVMRVLQSAREIQRQVGGDPLTIDLAVLLHDVGDAKFHDGVERSEEFARQILGDLGADEKLIDHVAHIVNNISFRKGAAAETLSWEGKIVQDADRLDALGAIGIVRTIEYGAAFGQPFYLPDDETGKTGVSHFYDKLFKLKDLLNTAAARQMAEQREQFMHAFLNQFLSECGARE